MKTLGITKRLAVTWAIVWVFLSPASAGGALLAQEPTLNWVAQEKARIGVLLEELCEGIPTTESVCDRPPVVTSVVVGGPADQAGVRARDTLLSVNGLDVTRTEGRTLLLGLEAGVPVELEIGRAEGRRKIQVTPEMRATEPYVDVRTMFFGPPGELTEGARNRVQVVRIPSVRARLGELEVRLDSLRAQGNEFVFFREDSAGKLEIEVGDPEKAHVILQRIREYEERPDQPPALQGDSVAPDGGPGTEWVDLPRYVWENEKLARRLTQVRDSSFHSARMRLDSLVRLGGQVQVLKGDSLGLALSVSRVGPDGEWAYYVTPRPLSGQMRTLLSSDLRVAGAEFRELGSDLAEYFDGANEGLLVLRVIPDTPAARIGLRGGDVVVEVDGAICSHIKVLRDAIAHPGPDGAVQVKWVRKGVAHTANLASR